MQATVLRDMGQGVDVGPDVAASDDQLVGRRASVGPDGVAVTPSEHEAELRMVGRLGHPDLHRAPEIEHPHAVCHRVEDCVAHASGPSAMATSRRARATTAASIIFPSSVVAPSPCASTWARTRRASTSWSALGANAWCTTAIWRG